MYQVDEHGRMQSTEAEFKRRLQLNAEGLPLLKSASSTIKHADVAKGKGQLLQSSEKEVETLHRKRFFDADKKFKELLQTPISKLMPDLKRDNVKASISALQSLSSILSDNEDLHAEISSFLDKNKFPETLTTKVRDALSGKYGDDLSWSYLSEIFNVVNTLVNDDHKEAFIKSMIDEDFTELTIQFLRHPTVLNQYQKDPVLTRTVVSALGVLVPMFLYSPSIDAQELNDTYGEYLQSSNDDVRMLAQKSAFALSMILLRSVVEQQEGGDGYKPSESFWTFTKLITFI
ncbi:uncharacterized protein [Ptychodera flava]|uniref:uncharacterized protein n=1 Tax=Ptychodera flava TaxID=63121 RepID=UPI00396A4E6F